MFTKTRTELSQRIFLTVLILLLFFGKFNSVTGGGSDSNDSKNSLKEVKDNTFTIEKNEKKQTIETRSDDFYNPFDKTIKYLNEKALISPSPLPFKIASQNENNSQNNGFRRRILEKFPKNKNRASGVDPDCFFGKDCPESYNNDDWKTYYSALNNFKNYGDFYNRESINFNKYASIPFSVTSKGAHTRRDDYFNPTKNYKNSPPEPSWTKLEAVLPARVYDPFLVAKNQSNETSTLLKRVGGQELNPETFAERHGWKEDKSGKIGSRIPPWLEELNYQHGGLINTNNKNYDSLLNINKNPNSRPGIHSIYEEDRPHFYEDEKKWVKLDAVPVAGVTISKWVPKGTSPSELPSTNWKNNNKPSAWWDRIDDFQENNKFHKNYQNNGQIDRHDVSNFNKNYQNNYQRPSYGPPIHEIDAVPWAVKNKYPPHSHEIPQKNSHEAWSDIIYPNNNPLSASATWASEKGSNKNNYAQKYPENKYPAPSWPPLDFNREKDSYFSNYGNKPSNYPDPNAGKDDSRWILVSSSKAPNLQNSHNFQKYNEKNIEFPYPYQNNRMRQSKTMNLTGLIGGFSRYPPQISKDELFRRTNESLYSLRPYLNKKNDKNSNETTENSSMHSFFYQNNNDNRTTNENSRPPVVQSLVDIIASTGANIIESTTKKFRMNVDKNEGLISSNDEKSKGVLGNISPVYAAVGAGMIPATLGAVIPMVLGRKKRNSSEKKRDIKIFNSYHLQNMRK